MVNVIDTAERSELTSVLIRLCRECDVPVENLRAEQLIRDAQSAWPGEELAMWGKWLREASNSLALRARVADLSVDDALHLAEDGALLVVDSADAGRPIVLLGCEGRRVTIAEGDMDGRRNLSRASFEQLLPAPQTAPSGGPALDNPATRNRSTLASAPQSGDPKEGAVTSRWLVVEHPEMSNADDARHLHDRPVERLMRLLQPEWSDIWIILVFAFFAGVLNLATPIAVEALVNTVAFGRMLQPVVILAALLFGFLVFAAVMHGMQTFVAEIIQRRLFTRVAADLAYRLPRVDRSRMGPAYGPELVNRFLDVATVQKVVASLLLDGVGIVLATLVGMAVLAFYHPWLLGFDVLLLGLITAGLYVLGRGAISSGIDESKMKYRLTSWFEDIMRCELGFKTGGAEFALDRANQLTAGYLSARRSHFRILFRQIVFVLALQAIAGTVLLGAGGWLVVQGQLSLGQLVAAELIVTTILTSLAKLGKHLEGFYDSVAAIDKLGALLDLAEERQDGQMALFAGPSPRIGGRGRFEGLDVQLTKVGLGGPGAAPLTTGIAPSEKLAVCGPRGSGKTRLLRALYGLEPIGAGHLEVGGSDPSDMRPDLLRSMVTLVGEPEAFSGTIADNIRVGRPGVSTSDVRWALEKVGLLDDVLRLPGGIDTPLNASAAPLSTAQQRLLVLARALAGRPQLLLVDGSLDALPDADLQEVCRALAAPESPWTLLVSTGRQDIAERFERTIDLDAPQGPATNGRN